MMLSRRDFVRIGLAGFAAFPALVRAVGQETFVGRATFDRVLMRAREGKWQELPIGETVGRVGSALIGTPYVGSTLELFDDREVCCVNLEGLDCVTFYETALAFARMLHRHKSRPADLVAELTLMRYRGGKLDGYLSRLHYTSDWFFDNARKKVVTDLTEHLPGALRMEKRFDFMSTHPSAYRQLKAHPEWVTKMAGLENEISARHPWYVPNERVADAEPLLQTGDIVGIATRADGLDCSHTGLVFVDDAGVRRFLNASSVQGKVVLGERLSDYAAKYKKNLGVMISRPL